MPPHDAPHHAPFAGIDDDPRLVNVLRSLLAVEAVRLAPGFPRWLAGVRAALGRGHSALSLRATTGGGRVVLFIPHVAVLALAERVLGGSGRMAEAVHGLAPLPAELGCVAYVAARLLGVRAGDFQIDDVSVEASTALAALPEGLVAWPIALVSELGPFGLHAVAAPGVLVDQLISVRLSLGDTQPLPPALAQGDLLLAEGARLSLLVDGPAGDALLRADGIAADGVAALAGGRAHVRDTRPRAHYASELVLSERQLDERALCALQENGITWPLDGSEPGCARDAEARRAFGRLVTLRGALGLRVDTLF